MPQYTDADLISRLRAFAAEHGKTPTARDVQTADNLPSHTTYTKRFGSWNQTLEEAGLTPNQTHEHLSDDELLDRLRTFAAEQGRSPKAEDILTTDYLPSFPTYRKRFGSWNNALEAAGLDKHRHHFTDEELLEKLRAFADDPEDPPSKPEVDAADEMPSGTTYENRFGRWNAAVREAGLEPNTKGVESKQYTDEELCELLRAFATHHREELSSHAVKNAEEMPSPTTYTDRFGDWEAALREAGLLLTSSHD